MTNRREFLRNAIAVVIASRFAAGSAAEKAAPAKKMTLLLIGDGFVAKQVAEVATRHGHTVTQVSRALRKGGQVLRGEDKTDLIVAEGQRWDAVVDTSARVPADVTGTCAEGRNARGPGLRSLLVRARQEWHEGVPFHQQRRTRCL